MGLLTNWSSYHLTVCRLLLKQADVIAFYFLCFEDIVPLNESCITNVFHLIFLRLACLHFRNLSELGYENVCSIAPFITLRNRLGLFLIRCFLSYWRRPCFL